MVSLGVAARALVMGAVCAVPAAAVDGPLLAPANQSIDRLLPRSVIETIEAPATTPRVAARPTLNWAPGLKKAVTSDNPSEQATPEEKEEAPKAEAAPRQPAPALVGPRVTESKPAAPPETALLPKQTPRAKAKHSKPAATPAAEGAAKEPAPLAAPEKTRPIKSAEPKPQPKREAKPKVAPKREPEVAKEKPAPVAKAPEREPPPPLSRSLRGLRSRLRTVLSFYYRKPLNTVEHDPWEIMHSMLSYELHSRIHDGGPGSPYMTAIGHLCYNRPSKRQRLMRLAEDGSLRAKVGVGVQGHKGQFLAMLAQCNVSPDYPIRVEGKSFTIRDLIDAEQRSCESKTELTFKLMGLGHYLDSDAEWLDERGERWDIPRLIREEREQPIRGAACGGTHRLAGLSLAFRRREARGEPVDGEYAEAARFVSQYQGYAFRLQNDDGSFSTEWFRGPGDEEDIDRRLRTTGHLLEWLVYTLPEDELRSHRTVRAVNYLTNLLAGNADHEWHLGSIAHGLHALVLYDKRVFRPHDKRVEGQLAAVDPTGRLFREYPIYRGVMRNSPPQHTGLFQGLFGNPRTSGSSKSRR